MNRRNYCRYIKDLPREDLEKWWRGIKEKEEDDEDDGDGRGKWLEEEKEGRWQWVEKGEAMVIQNNFCLVVERKAEFKRQRRGKQTNGFPGDSR